MSNKSDNDLVFRGEDGKEVGRLSSIGSFDTNHQINGQLEFKTWEDTYVITTVLGEVFTQVDRYATGGWIIGSSINKPAQWLKDGYTENSLHGSIIHKVAKVSVEHKLVN